MFKYMMFKITKELMYNGARHLGLMHGAIMSAIVVAIIGGVAYKLFYHRKHKRSRK